MSFIVQPDTVDVKRMLLFTMDQNRHQAVQAPGPKPTSLSRGT